MAATLDNTTNMTKTLMIKQLLHYNPNLIYPGLCSLLHKYMHFCLNAKKSQQLLVRNIGAYDWVNDTLFTLHQLGRLTPIYFN